jgi:hypothetical protein
MEILSHKIQIIPENLNLISCLGGGNVYSHLNFYYLLLIFIGTTTPISLTATTTTTTTTVTIHSDAKFNWFLDVINANYFNC